MDWERQGRKRVSRRWFLGATAAAGAAGLAAACGGGGGRNPAMPFDDPSPTPGGSGTSEPHQAGQTLRYTGFVQTDGTFDPHKTQAGPLYGMQSLVFSRLLAYERQDEGLITADLAAAMPEQPDPQTLVFKLNPGAKWHDHHPLNGRAVTADDVKFSIERQRDGDASFIRKARWQLVSAVEVSNPTTVTVKLVSPLANALNLFADVNSFIVAPELAEGGRDINIDMQVGSGPFRLVEWSEGKFSSVVKNKAWHGGNGRPYLDGITVTQPLNASDVEAQLRTKKIDVAFVGRPTAEALKKNVPSLYERTVGNSHSFGMRFFINQVPYNDVRMRSALTIALDRRKMIDQFFAGSGDVNPWISWPVKRWTLPQSELTTIPGYRPGEGGREEDIKEARALLAAFASEKSIPADLPLFVLDEAETSLQMGTVIADQLIQTLGVPVTVHPTPIGSLIDGLLNGSIPWAAAPDSGWIDLDDWVYPYFHSTGTKNTFPLRDNDVDALVTSQRTEMNENNRREIGFEIQRRLLALNVGVNLVSERVVALARSYVKDFPLDIAEGYEHLLADCSIDPSDPDFRGR